MGRKRSHGPYRYLGRILGLKTFVRYCAANLHVIGLFDASITSPCWVTTNQPTFSPATRTTTPRVSDSIPTSANRGGSSVFQVSPVAFRPPSSPLGKQARNSSTSTTPASAISISRQLRHGPRGGDGPPVSSAGAKGTSAAAPKCVCAPTTHAGSFVPSPLSQLSRPLCGAAHGLSNHQPSRPRLLHLHPYRMRAICFPLHVKLRLRNSLRSAMKRVC
ncbi:hypothetical protein BHE74_00028256 [Ensete ventricosum]|nr:hypothetical protein BHE74_00028256 [Ensete ventricosum]